jgi:hypothetical protein
VVRPGVTAQRMAAKVRKSKDLEAYEGSVIGEWTVLSTKQRKGKQAAFLCRCSCGEEKLVSANHLLAGDTRQCRACFNKSGKYIKNLIGRKFGRWTPFELVRTQTAQGKKTVSWRCRCDCGVEAVVIGGSLINGDSTSCGCYKLECNRGERGGSGLSMIYATYRINARKRNLAFEMTIDEFKELTSSRCYYCDAEPQNTSESGGLRTEAAREHSRYIYSGVDRVDNELGYIIGNCVPCCKDCNKAKMDRPLAEYLAWLKKTTNHLVELGKLSL